MADQLQLFEVNVIHARIIIMQVQHISVSVTD